LEEHWQTTQNVLGELGARDKEIITVFNKSDLLDDPVVRARLQALHPDAIFISAKTGIGLEELKKLIISKVRPRAEVLQLSLPPERHDLAAAAYEKGQVLSSEYDDDGNLKLAVTISHSCRRQFAEYVIE